MKKILLILTLSILTISIVFVVDIFITLSNGPRTEYGHLLLKDRTGKVITDKGRSGGYALPYTGDTDTDLVRGIIAMEDARFYDHHGVNMQAKIASIVQNFQAGGIVRGGSTITEQYIKNAYYPGTPRTVIQKIREAIAALIIERQYRKDDILRKYLSSVYMGNGLYGIATVIDGSPDHDTILDTITRLKFPNSTQANSGAILEYRKKIGEKIGMTGEMTHLFDTKNRISTNLYPILTSRVDQEISLYCNSMGNSLKLWTKSIPPDLCVSGEKNITLTIDANLTDTAEGISRGILKSLEREHVSNASIYILDPKTNTILTYIGSANPGESIDMISRPRSVGSILKPFIYRFALQSGADSEDYLLDDKTAYETGVEGQYFIPENYTPKSYGPIRLREALGNSLNSATVRLTDTLGIGSIYTMLLEAGISLDHDVGYYGYGISLGTVEASMENIVSSYRSLLDFSDPDTWQIAQILRDSRNRARTFGISSILNTSIPLSVKTGTSTDFRDNWTLSYSPDAIIGVWVGNTDGSAMGDVSGVTGAGPIWHQIAEYMIAKGMIRNQVIPPPTSLQQISICLDTKCLRKELMYTKKPVSPKSRPADSLYFQSDFFGEISSDEKTKWKIQ